MIAFVDGVFTEEPKISALDVGFQHGDGLFETMRVAGGRVFRIDAHLERLRASLAAVGIPEPAPIGGLDEIVGELASREKRPECMARVTISRGELAAADGSAAPHGPTMVVHLRAVSKPPAGGRARVVVSSVVRAASSDPALKSISFQPLVLAHRAALARGAHEALMLDPVGFVVEGAHSNIFWASGGELRTPSLDLGALPGVMRRFVIREADDAGTGFREVRHMLDRVQAADEVFITSVGIGIVGVASIEGEAVGEECPGLLTRSLAERLDAELAIFRRESTSSRDDSR
ncbi:MAG: hypothetical protein CME06_01970 [Gemmatimonadetes bacterium]|nr:hypothetical protein [Gemmatimonadota bacterium]